MQEEGPPFPLLQGQERRTAGLYLPKGPAMLQEHWTELGSNLSSAIGQLCDIRQII